MNEEVVRTVKRRITNQTAASLTASQTAVNQTVNLGVRTPEVTAIIQGAKIPTRKTKIGRRIKKGVKKSKKKTWILVQMKVLKVRKG